MIGNFKFEAEGVNFEFLTVNRVRLQLYQVYVQHEGKRIRFHMEVEEDGNFHIKDKTVCPEIYLPLETKLSDAIKEFAELKEAD